MQDFGGPASSQSRLGEIHLLNSCQKTGRAEVPLNMAVRLARGGHCTPYGTPFFFGVLIPPMFASCLGHWVKPPA
jgi:hypothetical protein